MSFIDNKGRLFGRVNVIDALAILLMIAIVVSAGVYVNKINTQRSAKKTGDSVYITYDVELKNMLPEVAESIKPDDKITDDVKNIKLGVIKDIRDKKPSEDLRENILDGAYVTTASPNKYQAVITVESSAAESNDMLKIGDIDIKVGKQLSIKSGDYTATGFIIAVRNHS